MEWTWYYHRPTKTSRINVGFYQVIEDLKNGRITSQKYSGKVKYLGAIPHVIVFANWKPNFSKLSRDRWVLRQIKVKADLISQEEIPVTPQMWDECILYVRYGVRPTNIKKYRTSVLYLSDGLRRRFRAFVPVHSTARCCIVPEEHRSTLYVHFEVYIYYTAQGAEGTELIIKFFIVVKPAPRPAIGRLTSAVTFPGARASVLK